MWELKPKNMSWPLIKRHWDKAVIAAVLTLFSVQFFHFVYHEETIPQSDTISHSAFAARLHHILAGEKPPSAYQRCAHPPLTQLVSGVFFRVLGLSHRSALGSLWIFCLVFLLSVYGLGFHLGGKIGGLAVLLLTASHPEFVHYGRQYFIDLPAAATALLALYVLLRTDGFRRKGPSLLFGLCLGLAMLTKWTNLVFVAPPLLVLLVAGCRRSARGLGILSVGFAISLALLYGYYLCGTNPSGRGVVGLHYLVYLVVCAGGVAAALLMHRRVASVGEQADSAMLRACNGTAALFLAQALAYPVYLFQAAPVVMHFMRQGDLVHNDTFLGLLTTNIYSLAGSFSGGLLLLLAGLVFALRFVRGRRLWDMGLLGLSMVVGLLATSHSCPAFFRYLLVNMGLLAVVGGFWLGRSGRFGVVGLVALGAYFALPASAYFWGAPDLPLHDENRNVRSVRQLWQDFDLRPRRVPPPIPGSYHLEEMMETIQGDFRRRFEGRPQVPLVLESVFTDNFQKGSRRRDLPMIRQDFLFFCSEYFLDSDLIPRLRDDDIKVAMGESRLIPSLQVSGDPVYLVVFYIHQAEVADLQIRIHLKLARRSRLLKSFQLPDRRRTMVLLIDAAK